MTTIQDNYDLDDFYTGGFNIPSTISSEYLYSLNAAKSDGSPLPSNSSIGVFRPGWNFPDNPDIVTQIGLLTRDDDYSFSGVLYGDDPATGKIEGGVPGDGLTFLIYNGLTNDIHNSDAAPYTFTGQASEYNDIGSLREGSALGVPEPSTAILLGSAIAFSASYALGKRALVNVIKGTRDKISGLAKKLL